MRFLKESKQSDLDLMIKHIIPIGTAVLESSIDVNYTLYESEGEKYILVVLPDKVPATNSSTLKFTKDALVNSNSDFPYNDTSNIIKPEGKAVRRTKVKGIHKDLGILDNIRIFKIRELK